MEAKARVDLDVFWWKANGICGWIRLLGQSKFKDDSSVFVLGIGICKHKPRIFLVEKNNRRNFMLLAATLSHMTHLFSFSAMVVPIKEAKSTMNCL